MTKIEKNEQKVDIIDFSKGEKPKVNDAIVNLDYHSHDRLAFVESVIPKALEISEKLSKKKFPTNDLLKIWNTNTGRDFLV
jgi:hypothetical protein